MSNEKPIMSEKYFIYASNLVILDTSINLMTKLIACDKIKKEDVEDILLMQRTIRKELDDAFDVEAEDTHDENVHVNEEIMGADEESDVNAVKKPESIHENRGLDKPLNFDEVH